MGHGIRMLDFGWIRGAFINSLTTALKDLQALDFWAPTLSLGRPMCQYPASKVSYNHSLILFLMKSCRWALGFIFFFWMFKIFIGIWPKVESRFLKRIGKKTQRTSEHPRQKKILYLLLLFVDWFWSAISEIFEPLCFRYCFSSMGFIIRFH